MQTTANEVTLGNCSSHGLVHEHTGPRQLTRTNSVSLSWHVKRYKPLLSISATIMRTGRKPQEHQHWQNIVLPAFFSNPCVMSCIFSMLKAAAHTSSKGLFLEATAGLIETTPYCLLNVAKFQTRPGYYSLQLLIKSLYVLNGHKGGEFFKQVPDRFKKLLRTKAEVMHFKPVWQRRIDNRLMGNLAKNQF